MSRYKINNLEEYLKNIKNHKPKKFWGQNCIRKYLVPTMGHKVLDFNMVMKARKRQ
jgi:hypothetical protein